jgi:hypothetical protein
MSDATKTLVALLALMLITSCGPLLGAGAAVAVDEAEEREDGDEGLF